MGWLSCDPDDMFKQHVYTGPAVYGKLAPVAQAALTRAAAALPPAVTTYFQHTRVVAAPMQVRSDFDPDSPFLSPPKPNACNPGGRYQAFACPYGAHAIRSESQPKL